MNDKEARQRIDALEERVGDLDRQLAACRCRSGKHRATFYAAGLDTLGNIWMQFHCHDCSGLIQRSADKALKGKLDLLALQLGVTEQ